MGEGGVDGGLGGVAAWGPAGTDLAPHQSQCEAVASGAACRPPIPRPTTSLRPPPPGLQAAKSTPYCWARAHSWAERKAAMAARPPTASIAATAAGGRGTMSAIQAAMVVSRVRHMRNMLAGGRSGAGLRGSVHGMPRAHPQTTPSPFHP